MARVWANQLLLDRVISSAEGDHIGMVDDLELDEPAGGGPPVVTALLSGPTALGPRIGGRLGVWWLAIGRRLRPTGAVYPNRVPIELVTSYDPKGVELRVPSGDVDTGRLEKWLLDKVVTRIPGNGS